MAFDYKKEYKEFYMPGKKPILVEMPPMNYVAVRGHLCSGEWLSE